MGFHGWRIAWALAVTQTVGYGVLYYAFAVFTLPMEAELGLSRAQTSGAFSVGLLVAGLTAVPVGRWVDARGARVPMSVGSAAGALLVLAWSFVDGLTGLMLVQAGIGLAMAATLYDVAFTAIATWFRRDRIRAMLIVTTVAGLASTVFVPLATVLVETVGWREALRWLALLLGATALPLHALVLRDHPRRLGLEPDGGPARSLSNRTAALELAPAPEASVGARQALRSGAFWWLSTAFAFDRVAIVAVAAHAVPMLLERGHTPALVAAVAGSIGLMQVVGRLLFAPATSRASLVHLASLTYVVRALALLGLLLVPGALGLWGFATLFGLANGASTLARAGLVADAFGPAHYGTINGAMTSLMAVAQTAAPLAVGALHVRTGGYDAALWALAAVALLAALAVAKVRT
ncbi:MAG: MFS transporter [Trueperaceae bacterium]